VCGRFDRRIFARLDKISTSVKIVRRTSEIGIDISFDEIERVDHRRAELYELPMYPLLELDPPLRRVDCERSSPRRYRNSSGRGSFQARSRGVVGGDERDRAGGGVAQFRTD
jgi:hypothetical protein